MKALLVLTLAVSLLIITACGGSDGSLPADDSDRDESGGFLPSGEGDGIDIFIDQLPNDERIRQVVTESQKEIDAQVQAAVDNLLEKREAFEKIVITVGAPVKMPKEHRPGTGINGFKFPVTIENQTSQPHRVYYTISLTYEIFNPTTGGCDPNFWPQRTRKGDESSEIEVPAFGTIKDEVEWRGLTLNTCIDANISDYYEVVEKIDGSTLDHINKSLDLLQTSPDN